MAMTTDRVIQELEKLKKLRASRNYGKTFTAESADAEERLMDALQYAIDHLRISQQKDRKIWEGTCPTAVVATSNLRERVSYRTTEIAAKQAE